MRHIMVLNAKGGSGKTTIATNLAAWFASMGQEVILADLDPQGSSLAWLAARSPARPRIRGVAASREGVRPGRNTDVVIYDAPAAVHGRDLGTLLRKVETVLIPVLPSPIDMRAASDFVAEVRKNSRVDRKEVKIALVANRVREFTNIYHELESFLKKMKIPVVTHLRDNMNYIRAAERGLGIHEFAPHATDIDRQQWEPLVKWVKSKRSQP
ncbi:MAG: AAA family ATPase [Gammaproteobacteria bacterium]|jgi:chromosome partitioning protein